MASRPPAQRTAASRKPSRTGRTRAALLAAGFDLMVDRPIDAIAIDEVVARAGVAKGSFFNHFIDKHGFAAAVAATVRLEVEAEVARANAGVADPMARIAGGMAVAARLALDEPRRMTVLLRAQEPTTSQSHPLNRGLRGDVEAALAQGLLRPEAEGMGVTYWLGLCQMMMAHFIVTRPPRELAASQLAGMLVLGLTGLGVPPERAARIAAEVRV